MEEYEKIHGGIMKIEKNQLKEIEFLFSQSAKGLHLLFDDTKKITDILKTPTKEKQFFSSENMKRIETLFTGLVAEKSFAGKKKYLNNLNRESFEIVVRTYFHIVDNTILTVNKSIH